MTNSYNDKSQSLQTMYINHYIIEFPKLHQQTPWSTNINNVSSFITLHTTTTLQANLFSADVFCAFLHSFFSCSASAGPWSQETQDVSNVPGDVGRFFLQLTKKNCPMYAKNIQKPHLCCFYWDFGDFWREHQL